MRIDDMKPGPELDRTLDTLMHGHEYKSFPAGWMYHNGSKWMVAPPYSSTWGGMSLVVEEMQRRGFNGVIAMRQDGYGAGFSKDGIHYATNGDSTPHIVTLAAIKALQGEELGDIRASKLCSMRKNEDDAETDETLL